MEKFDITQSIQVIRGYCKDEDAEMLCIEQYNKILLCFPKNKLQGIIPLEPKRREGKTYNAYYVEAGVDITQMTATEQEAQGKE